MKKYGRTDNNQTEVVKALRKIPGLTVWSTASMGNGFPDLVVGYRDKNYLIELKNPDMPPSKRRLSDDEKVFHRRWCGQVDVCHTVEEIIIVVFGEKLASGDEIPF